LWVVNCNPHQKKKKIEDKLKIPQKYAKIL